MTKEQLSESSSVLDAITNIQQKPRRVLFAYDESDHSKSAITKMVKYHLKREDSIYVLNVHPSLKAGSHLFSDKTQYDKSYMSRVKLIQSICNKLETYKVTAFSVIKVGDPKKVIFETIKEFEIDHLIMGSRNLGKLKGFVLGSVSDHCVKNCKCSVTVIK